MVAGSPQVLIDLDRRISRALERGRGIKFNDYDLDALCSSGAYAVLHSAAKQALKAQVAERDKLRTRVARVDDPTEPAADGAEQRLEMARKRFR